jgi:S1-C subfamily serine protease
VVIGSAATGSAAARAGLQMRDVITAFDGKPLVSDAALARALSAHKPGDTVTLEVLRRGQRLTVPVLLSDAS